MVLPSGHEEYSRLRQMSQPSSEQPSYNPGTSAMQPPASTIGHPPVYSTDWSLRDPSMGYVSAALDPNLTMHTIEPTLPVGQPLVHSTGWPSYGSSMSHASASFETNYNIHTATAGPLPAVNDLYQNYTQSFSTGQSRATEAEFEDHLNPDQTTIQIQSSAPSHSTQERCSPNKLNAKVVNVEATSAHGKVQKKEKSNSLFKCRWEGCTKPTTFSTIECLLRHVKVQHITRRSIKCPVCGKGFGRRDNMNEHQRRCH